MKTFLIATYILNILWVGVRTFVHMDIRAHAIFDRAGRSCTYQMTTRTSVHISNYHPGRSFPNKLLPRTFVYMTIWFSKHKLEL